MASGLAVPRLNSTVGARKVPNLPVIEHPMSRMGNREDLSVQGSARIDMRKGKMFVPAPVSGDLSARLQEGSPKVPLNSARRSAPDRILQWPPEHLIGPNKSRFQRSETSISFSSSKPSEEQVYDRIKDKLTTGYHGLKHLFKANDPTGKGKVSRVALLRILYSLVGYISQDQYSRFLKDNSLDSSDHISFDDFAACFKDNETVQKEWLSPVQKVEMEDQNKRKGPEENLKHKKDMIVYDPYISAPFADQIFKEKITRVEDARKVFPAACFERDGMIVPPQLREAYALLGIYLKDRDFNTLWTRYDKEGLGAIRTHIFFKRVGVEGRPVTYTPRSKTCVNVKQRPKSELAQANAVDISTLTPPQAVQKEEALEQKEVKKVDITRKPAVNNGVSKTEAEPETKILPVKVKKKVPPKLENIIDCLHYRFEESYNAMMSAFELFDYMGDNFVSRVDFRRVLQEFGLNISVMDLDNFFSRNGVKTIRGQINYKEFLQKFQNKSENSLTNKVLSSNNHPFQSDRVPFWPMPQGTLTPEELEGKLIDLFHGDFIKLITFFKSCDKYSLGVITQHEFRTAIDKRLGYPMSNKQWEQLKFDVGTDKDGLVPYTKFLQLFDVIPGSWNRKQEGGLQVYQIVPSEMQHPSAVERLKEKAKTYMQPQEMEKPRNDGQKSIPELHQQLKDFFKNKIHTFDKHFRDMDRKSVGRMSKWQFGALLKLCGLVLTPHDLERIWATLDIPADGMYGYSALIKDYVQFNNDSQTKEKATDDVTNAQTKSVQNGSLSKQKEPIPQVTPQQTPKAATSQVLTQIVQQEVKPEGSELITPPGTGWTNKTSRTRDLLVKAKPQVISNWVGLKSVFKYIDKNGTATVSTGEMIDIMKSMKFPFTEDEFTELCQRFDLNKNGRFHYLEFMRCYSQRKPSGSNLTKSKSLVYSKHSHKLEQKVLIKI